VKYAPESFSGTTSEDKAEIEMLAHRLVDLTKEASIACYMEGIIQAELGVKLLSGIEPIVDFMEANKAKFLMGSEPTYPDFILFELCERIEFISESKLFKEYPILQRFHQNLMMVPEIL